ncbi:MAG TPA: HIT domain-containing protein [Pyrinomonadaceae bacterium]|nr:HIT domain-containing protein [Pyrinomonadaceae bacterium]
MDRLWSPWRYEYIASGNTSNSASNVCIFCRLRDDPVHDEGNFVVHRAKYNFVVLNIYPYISGHLLIVPNEHVGELDAAAKETTDELMDLTKRCQTALREVYQPTGFNIGMNLGKSAGAGVVDHIHIHILPRWTGDTNFMSTIANTRVIPEDLATTYQKLRARL